jgi:hypothetical protein
MFTVAAGDSLQAVIYIQRRLSVEMPVLPGQKQKMGGREAENS